MPEAERKGRLRGAAGRAYRSAGAGDGVRRGMGGEGSGECIAQPAGVHRRCVGERKCSARACRCAGASGSLRRGMGCGVGGEWIAQPAGVRRGRVGEQKCSGRACRCAGASEGLRRGMGCAVGGEGIAQPAGMRRGCVGGGSAREGRVAVRGRAKGFGGEWVVRSAGLTHFRRSRSRVRVLLYIRPPRHRCEIAAMGPKDAPCEHPSPAKTSAPAPSAFTLPRPRSPSPAYPLASRRMMFAPSAATFTLPPRRSHFPRIPFGDAHEDFGLPQQQLSTMGYPRKSYPHRCSPPCAKRSRPRACARVYIIYRSPVGCSRECPRRCGEEVTPL